jgi:hypothetical protein
MWPSGAVVVPSQRVYIPAGMTTVTRSGFVFDPPIYWSPGPEDKLLAFVLIEPGAPRIHGLSQCRVEIV